MKDRLQSKDIPDDVVLRTMAARHSRFGITPERPDLPADEELAQRFDVSVNLIHAKMERLEKRGLLDSGVSTRTGWPTEAGRVYMESFA